MSTKTSPLNTAGVPSTTTTNATTSASSSSSLATGMTSGATNSTAMHHAVKIKKELPSDEIKEFAENTMNELLGWYGFDGVDRLDLSAKTSRLLQSATNNANNAINQHHHQHHHMEKRRSRSRATTLLQLQQQNDHIRNITNNNNNNNNNNTNSNNNNNRKSAINCNNLRSSRSLGGGAGAGVVGGSGGGGGGGNESTTSDHDTRSSREDDSKSPHSAGKTTMEEKIDFHNCCWCRRPIPDNSPEFLTTSDGPRYCSESCFTQSRRASFKKAKTCDWCKHVRHAVSYVDFQDGASQLQFCSDKCLNQYKMQIFCKETQAHLDMNPHLREQGLDAVGNGAGLITPDLWLRNCRSRSASPASTISVSPGPSAHISAMSSPRITPPSCNQTAAAQPPLAVHKPMISVAPVSKLMSKSPSIIQNRQSPKHNRKKRPLRACVGANNDLGMGAKIGSQSGSGGGAGGGSTRDFIGMSKTKSLLSAGNNNNLRTSPGHLIGSVNPTVKSTPPTSLSQFAGSSVQDLHMSVPPLSPMLEQQQQPVPPHALTHGARGTSIPPAYFATPTNGQPTAGSNTQLPPAGFPPHPPFLPHPAAGLLPRFLGLPPPQPPMLQPDMSALIGSGLLGAPPPPVTVMVPYPIIIPLPIPIPVPLPIMDFYKAYLSPEEREKLREKEQKCRVEMLSAATNTQIAPASESQLKISAVESTQSTADEPLDFTKAKDLVESPTVKNEQNPNEATTQSDATTLNEDSVSLETVEPTASTSASITVTEEDSNSPHSTCVKATHCIVRTSEEPESSSVEPHAVLEAHNVEALGNNDSDDAKQKLPKFKITRLQTKRTLLIQTKESECSRPLRKRKRIIDCDFQKIALRDADLGEEQTEMATNSSAATAACNSNTKAYNSKK